MKKFLIVLLAAIIASSMMLGCFTSKGKVVYDSDHIPADSEYIGTWNGIKSVVKDSESPITDVFEDGFVLTLNADGSAKVFSGETDACKWVITDKGVSLTDGSKMSFDFVDGQLVTSILGVKIYLEKEAPAD